MRQLSIKTSSMNFFRSLSSTHFYSDLNSARALYEYYSIAIE